MKHVYDNLGAIVGFTVIVFLIQNFVGEKSAEYMVLFILFGMLILNSEKFINVLKKIDSKGEE